MYIIEVGNIYKSEKVAEVTTCELFSKLREIFASYCPKHVEEFLERVKDDLRMWRHHARVVLGWNDENGVFHCFHCSDLPRDWRLDCDPRMVELWVEEADDPLWFQERVERALEGGDWR